MAVQHTPIARKPQFPQHRPDLDHPYRWEFLMSGKERSINVELQDHQLLIESDPQEQQTYLEKVYQIISDPMLLMISNPARVTSTPANLGGDSGTTSEHGATAEVAVLGESQLASRQEEEDEDVAELSAIKNRVNTLEVTLNESPTIPPVGKFLDQKNHTRINWNDYDNQDQNVEDWVFDAQQEQLDYQNRWHEFIQRKQMYLSTPARKFTSLYHTCDDEFDIKNVELISEKMARLLTDQLLEAYDSVGKARQYCLEALDEQDLNANPNLGKYMEIKRTLLDKALHKRDEYLTKKRRMLPKSVLFYEPGKTSIMSDQGPIKVPKPMEGPQLQPPSIHEKEYQIPRSQPLMDFTTPQETHQENHRFSASMDFLRFKREEELALLINSKLQQHQDYLENLHQSYMGAIHAAMTNAQKGQIAMSRPSYGSEQKQKSRSILDGSYNAITTSTQHDPKPSTQNQARTKDGQCVFCKKRPHKYQLYCPNLKKMTPNEIFEIMREKRIFCRMCLCLGHDQNECQVVKDGNLKRCSIIRENEELCNGLHCRYLHQNYKKKSTPKSRQKF